MSVARILAVLLIAVEAAALAVGSVVLIPSVVTAVAAASLFLPWRIQLSRRGGLLLALIGGLAIYGALEYLRSLHSSTLSVPQFELGQNIGCYLLAIQATMLWAKRESDRPSILLPGLGPLVIVSAGLQSLVDWRANTFRLLVVAFVVLAGALFIMLRGSHLKKARPRRLRWRRGVIGILLVTTALISWKGGEAIDNTLDVFWGKLSPSRRSEVSGFSGSGDLAEMSSLRIELSDTIQLRVQSLTRPGYLRGRAFSRFSGWDWKTTLQQDNLRPLSRWPDSISGSRNLGSLFGRNPAAANDWRRYVCQLKDLDRHVFVPLGTTHIVAPSPFVLMDSDDVFLVDDWAKSGPTYEALVPIANQAPRISDQERRLHTSLPRGILGELDELAVSVFEGCTTSGEKISAVERYFHDNYEYQLDHSWVEDHPAPVLYFLRERPPAHCEFFATGAALLLRSSGVPCRYVTGYLAVEADSKHDYWLARGRHAHAWVEAFDNERGWVVVEATPAAGVPETTEFSAARRPNFGLWLPGWLASFPWLWTIAGILALVAGIGVMIVFRKALRRGRARRQRLAVQRDPLFSVLHQLLGQMDLYLRQFQLQRSQSETLHSFALRIRERARDAPHLRQAAQWYPIYAACRYDGDVDEESIAVLTERTKAAQQQPDSGNSSSGRKNRRPSSPATSE